MFRGGFVLRFATVVLILVLSQLSSAKEGSMIKYNPSQYYSGDSLKAALNIRNNEYKKLVALLKQHPSLASGRGEKNLPLLAWAMGHNNPEAFKYLLDAGATPNDFIMVGEAKMSLLSLATGAEDPQWLELLLTHKADPNGLPETEPPLFTAYYANRLDRLERLLSSGADINYPNEVGKTAIMVFAIARDYEMALQLVKRGANVYVQTVNGVTIRKIIERYPLPAATPQGRAQAELKKMLKESAIEIKNKKVEK
jgi:ankyrin repeat protein